MEYKHIFLTAVILVILGNVGIAWVGASAVTSAIKAVSGNCGQTYGVEPVIQGNWFCPKTK